jgi:hypothetical protein
MLNSLYAQLLADGKQSNGGGGLSARSVRYVHTILHRGSGTRSGGVVVSATTPRTLQTHLERLQQHGRP